jgi:trimeric autotransporter adhesin
MVQSSHRSSYRRWVLACVALLGVLLSVEPVSAQSDILLRLRSGSPAGDRMRVDSAGGFVAMGTLGIGIIPATGCGERTMWYPFRAAFRTGTPNYSGGACDQWDDSNIGFFSFAGGNENIARGYGTVALGERNLASGTLAAAMGSSNTVSGSAGFSAGASNECSGYVCVAIGTNNRAAGQGAVALGERVHASADGAVALGRRAHAKHNGAFAWGDASTTDSLRSTANNQFSIRAAGGIRLFTNAAMNVGVTMNAGGSTWNAVSDRNRKENILGVDGEQILLRLRGVPVTSWNYIAEGREVRHIGPMAQDWHRAFGLNADSLTINQGDFDGINLAAIQALERRTTELRGEVSRRDATIAALEQRVADLEATNTELERRVARIEELLRRDDP